MAKLEISALTWSQYSNNPDEMIAPIPCDLATYTEYNIYPSGARGTLSAVKAADGVAIDNLLNAYNIFVQMGEYVETVPAYTKSLLQIPSNSPMLKITASGQVALTLFFYVGRYPGSQFGTNYLAVQTEASLAVRTGICEFFAGQPVNIPVSTLIADGSAVSRTTYLNLFSKIGTLYGAGDGSTTFNLPNVISACLIGAGIRGGYATKIIATLYGAETKSLVAAENGPHGHGVTDPTHAHPLVGGAGAPGSGTIAPLGQINPSYFFAVGAMSNAATNISIQSSGSGTAFSLMQPSLAMTPIIWT